MFFIAIAVGLINDFDTGPEYPQGASEEQKAKIMIMHRIKKTGGKNIISAEEEWYNQRLSLKYQPDSIYDGKGWITSYFISAIDIMKELQNIHPSNNYKQIVFDVMIPTVSRLGESGDTRGMLIQYNWDELKKANWQNLYNWDAGNLAEKISFYPLGLQSAIEYCQDSKNTQYSMEFCKKVLNEIID